MDRTTKSLEQTCFLRIDKSFGGWYNFKEDGDFSIARAQKQTYCHRIKKAVPASVKTTKTDRSEYEKLDNLLLISNQCHLACSFLYQD